MVCFGSCENIWCESIKHLIVKLKYDEWSKKSFLYYSCKRTLFFIVSPVHSLKHLCIYKVQSLAWWASNRSDCWTWLTQLHFFFQVLFKEKMVISYSIAVTIHINLLVLTTSTILQSKIHALHLIWIGSSLLFEQMSLERTCISDIFPFPSTS